VATSYLDIPPQNRGTLNIGNTEYHFERGGDKVGHALMLVPGPDLRDWDAIDLGALDYSAIARQEHDIPGFTGHDGPKIAKACAVCRNGTAALPTQDPQAALRSLAAQGNTNAQEALRRQGLTWQTPTAPAEVTSPPPEHLSAEQEARVEAKRARAEADRLRAMLDQRDKRTLELARINEELNAVTEPTDTGPQVTGAADPKDNAGIPPSDPDVIAGAAPDIQAQSLEAFDRPEHGTDPFTGEQVKIRWAVTGASEAAPYGLKSDGSPRKPGGTSKKT